MTSLADRPSCGRAIGDWVIVGDLGCGLSGDVFTVRHANGPNDIAVAKCHRQWACGVSEETFQNEIQILADQPIPGNMPHLIASGKANGSLFIIMSYADELPQRDALSVEQWFDCVLELLDAFERLNDRARIFHRDVKPKNLRSVDGHPVIIDFGLAVRRKQNDEPLPLERVGSRDFMAPEIIRYEPYTVRAEIYSVGKTLQAIVPDIVKQSLSAALFHATENDLGQRTPSWTVFKSEVEAGRTVYRREHHRMRAAVKCVGITAGVCIAIYLTINGLALVWRILTLSGSD